MPLPPLNQEGELPPGVHCATLTEVLDRFGKGSLQRRAVAERLSRIYQLAASTGPFPPEGDENLAEAVRASLARTIRLSRYKPEELAERLSKRLGVPVSHHVLYSFTAESRPGHRFPLEWAAAWMRETGDHSLLRVLCDALGLAMPEPGSRELARFVIFGSFVTAKPEPNDIDIVVLMENTFDLASVTGETSLVFQHMEAVAHFGASIFWTRRLGALGGEQAMIEYWQVRRDGGLRGIVEIVPEGK